MDISAGIAFFFGQLSKLLFSLLMFQLWQAQQRGASTRAAVTFAA